MIGRAVVAFIALPGVLAFALPLLIAHWTHPSPVPNPLGLIGVLGGLLVLLWCAREFYVAGRGTLAPWDPPRILVVSGPYRYCRNPMYIGVELILIGWAAFYRSATLASYALVVAIAFHLRAVLAEEPWAAATFGDAWSAYRSRTPRWLPRKTTP
jgi:protein-S-isoprenylcysteine O-methyltransferase Ste14